MNTFKYGVYKHDDIERQLFNKSVAKQHKKTLRVEVCYPHEMAWEYHYLYEKTVWEAEKGVETFADTPEKDMDDWFEAYKLEREFLALIRSILKNSIE